MLYRRLLLKGFKPLGYGGTRQLELKDIGQVVILSGENGKGKSSVMRELTPYPATRTDYEKDGLKVIEIEHNGSLYVLTSDFSKPGSPHSFRKDDVELNVGGTTDVQQDLVHQYFDEYTPLVEKLTSGKYRFSEMSKNERKQVLMATYPSSLLFVLEKYKNLASKIRAANAQLKLMNERRIKLSEQILPDDVVSRQDESRKLLNDAILAIDKELYVLESQLRPLEESDAYKATFTYTVDDIKNAVKEITVRRDELAIRQAPKTPESLRIRIGKLTAAVDGIDEQLKTLNTARVSLIEEIEKYTDYMETDQSEMIKNCERDIAVQDEIIKANTFDDGVPVVDESTAARLRSISSNVKESLDTLRSLDVELWTEEKYEAVAVEARDLETDLRIWTSRLEEIRRQIDALDARLEEHKGQTYPASCTYSCRLKEILQDTVGGIRAERDELVRVEKKSEQDIEALRKRVESLRQDLQSRTPSIVIIRKFNNLLASEDWGNFVLDGKSFVDAANQSTTEIWNRYVKVVKRSEAYIAVRRATELKRTLEAKLESVKSVQMPAKAIISSLLARKEIDLRAVEEAVDEKTDLKRRSNEELNDLNQHLALAEKARNLLANWQPLYEHLAAVIQVDGIRGLVDDLKERKVSLSEKLREFETVHKEQDSLRTRLIMEVEPVIRDLETKLNRWSLVEAQLSPSSGIPHKSIVRYINALFQKANAFISQVWTYGMELEYLREDEDCDYQFQVRINGDGIVKDISTCSKGQKEIIDLAIMLSICTYRKYAQIYPIKLDEMNSGLSVDHSARLIEFLGELFRTSSVAQVFFVNHDPSATSSWEDADYVLLSDERQLPATCHIISERT